MDPHKVVSQLLGKHKDTDFKYQNLKGMRSHVTLTPIPGKENQEFLPEGTLLQIKITSAGDSACTRLKQDNLLVEL